MSERILKLLFLAVCVVFVFGVFAVNRRLVRGSGRRGLCDGHSAEKAKRYSSDQSFHTFLVVVEVNTANEAPQSHYRRFLFTFGAVIV
ncbi:MAG: hypothetical protein ACO3B4_07710 [Burkholderiaceae bacterium]